MANSRLSTTTENFSIIAVSSLSSAVLVWGSDHTSYTQTKLGSVSDIQKFFIVVKSVFTFTFYALSQETVQLLGSL